MIPLRSVSMSGNIRQVLAQVCLQQIYFNGEDKVIEAVYLFPLDDKAAICGFEAEINNKVVIGEVQGKKKARETYNNAIAQGHGAYLLEQKKKTQFEISVGNIPPQTRVVISITFCMELEYVGHVIRCTLLSNSVFSGNVQPIPFSLKMDVNTTSALTSLRSVSHSEATATMQDRSGTLAYEVANIAPGDFVIEFSVLYLHEPLVFTEYNPKTDSYAVLLSYVPDLSPATSIAPEKVNSEFVFVVDRSGSMGGTRMRQAARTLMDVLKLLPASVLFNVISFGSTHSSLFPESQPLSDEHRARALMHVAGLKATMGGTDVLGPLQAIASKPPAVGHSRQLVLITDGEVDNTSAVIRAARASSGDTRIFAFGIGREVSQELVDGLARAGGGKSSFSVNSADIRGQVAAQVARALSPSLTHMRVGWMGLDATQVSVRRCAFDVVLIRVIRDVGLDVQFLYFVCVAHA